MHDNKEYVIQEVFDQLQEMAVGILQPIEDPAWNKDSPPDFLPQTREFQQWYEDHPDPETADSMYGTNICLKRTDKVTYHLICSAEMCGRYESHSFVPCLWIG
jgi:hypothetical protein